MIYNYEKRTYSVYIILINLLYIEHHNPQFFFYKVFFRIFAQRNRLFLIIDSIIL